ncbi:MAG: class I poly(R)-hydroxyalkanoic acid synthase [Rhizobiales bacterium]|nr:class I poly(R)-hydroxyalkanoic acid synthase [Hyphomicrobiales bacterium]
MDVDENKRKKAQAENIGSTTVPEADPAEAKTGIGKSVSGQKPANDTDFEFNALIDDPETFARNTAEIVQELGRLAAAYIKPVEERGNEPDTADRLTDFFTTIAQVGKYWLEKPERTLEVQNRIAGQYMQLWANAMKRFSGEKTDNVIAPSASDRRFSDKQWQENPLFDFLKQGYLITASWASDLVDEAKDLDPHTKLKAQFYMTQLMNAISPSNFAGTNPEVIRETLASKGDNLVRGMKMLVEDMRAGDGALRIRQSSPTAFKVGENLAITPGKVVFQNDICQIIQYQATTEKVRKRPILIVPPWINKFYILDLTPEKSLIKWMVDQGNTVFVLSWVNPGRELASAGWDTYMQKGIFAACDVISSICPKAKIDLAAYCVGGTLASIALAHMAKTGDKRIASATFFTTQVDFRHAGELLVFIDEPQIEALERVMRERGYLEAGRMSTTFNLLRSNDLFWSYAVNNYLRGKEPSAFDLLHWNSDSTRMTPTNHAFYLRHLYMLNDITGGRIHLVGQDIDISRIKIPVFTLATKEDHIAPARSVLLGSTFYGGPVEFVLAGSGHIAGVINPPHKNKYGFMTKGEMTEAGDDLDHWQATATSHEGSWWPYWDQWVRALDNQQVPAREIGNATYPPIEDAPGSYVKKQSIPES